MGRPFNYVIMLAIVEIPENMSKKLSSTKDISPLGKLVTQKRVSFAYADAVRIGKG